VKYLAITLALLLSPLTACAEPSLTGIYKTEFESGTYASGADCNDPKATEKNDDSCVIPYQAENLLGLHQKDNSDLDFAIALSFFNGHSCGIGGTAKKDGKSWMFEKTEMESETCRLTFNIQDNKIMLDVPEGYSCQYYCGMRGTLDGAEFPLSSKTDQKISTKDDLAHIFSTENP